MTTNSSGASLSTIDVGGDHHDELFAVLSNARRRFVLQALQGADREMSVSELTSDLVSWEADMTDSEIVDDGRGAVQVALVHTHLPKMAEAGLVSYDDGDGSVRLTDWNDELEVHLAAAKAPATGGD